MRINTQLMLISTVTLTAVVFALPFMIWTLVEFSSAKNDLALGDEIRINYFDRASARNNYFLYREGRVRRQWEINKAKADGLLRQAEAQFGSAANQQALASMRRNLDESALIFRRIVGTAELLEREDGPREVYEELIKRLSSQLLLKDGAIRDAATALQDSSARRVESTYQRLIASIGLFAITLVLATVLTSMHLGRLIRKGLKPLYAGAKIVADGDLGHRIRCTGSDEFTELAVSINAMTDRLQAFTGRLEADLVELRQAEAALQASEARWKFALEGAGDGVWDWNPQTDGAMFSSRWKELIGFADDEFPDTGAAWVEHLHPDDRDRALSTIREYFDGKRPLYVVEFRMRCKDGSWKWLMSRGKVVCRDSEGLPLRMIGTHSDITERKSAEKYLRITSSVFDNSYQAIVITDANHVIVDANPAFAGIIFCPDGKSGDAAAGRVAGLSDIPGKKIGEVIPGIVESCPELFEAYARVAASGSLEKIETYVPQFDIWFSVSIYCPEPGGFVAIFDNVTERICNEQELIVLNNHLTQEVAKRTSELSSLTAHIQKISETEKANLARELHDELGSTLVGISMEVERLKGRFPDPERLEDMSVIRDLVANATRVTRGVINQLYPTVLDNCGFVAAVEWLAKEFKKHAGIEVELLFSETQIAMEQPFALAAYRIAQECLTNIAKHAAATRVSIEVQVGKGMLDMSIHDNGRGLSGGGVAAGGHGILGMMERARYLGGSMQIGSQGGAGTTARLCLPLAAPRPEKKKRVLVVDDHAIVRDALRQLLENQTDDFSVEGEATDGKEAVRLAVEEAWDIVLLDISLPKKNGVKALEEIVALKPELPIIMLSSHAQEEYGDLALSMGAAGYIEKGETDSLVEAMRRATLR